MKRKVQKAPTVRWNDFKPIVQDVRINRLLILTLIKQLEDTGVIKHEKKIEVATPEQTKKIINTKED